MAIPFSTPTARTSRSDSSTSLIRQTPRHPVRLICPANQKIGNRDVEIAYIVSTDPAKVDGSKIETGVKASLYGLGTAVCFAGSSIFIRYGLGLLASPLLGVTIGMLVATVVYALVFRSQMASGRERLTLGSTAMQLQIVAGILVALATWWRWVAIDLVPIAIVISLSRVSIPTVLILSPLIIGQKYEQVNRRVWLGAAVIIVGIGLLFLDRRAHA